MKCSVAERVTGENIERLKMAVVNGPRVYPGATHIFLDGNTLNKSRGNVFTVPQNEP